jgi:hypothetical protein
MPFSRSQYKQLEQVLCRYCHPSLRQYYTSVLDSFQVSEPAQNVFDSFLDSFQGAITDIATNAAQNLCYDASNMSSMFAGMNMMDNALGAKISRAQYREHAILLESLDFGGTNLAKEMRTRLLEALLSSLTRWGREETESELQASLGVAAAQSEQLAAQETRGYLTSFSQGAVRKQTNTASRLWASARKVSKQDLKLFQPLAGCMLEGRIESAPYVSTCCCVGIRDNMGSLLKVALYNWYDDSNNQCLAAKLDFAKKNYPQGAMLQVLEPFYKVGGDGSRFVRSDRPSESRVLSAAAGTATASQPQFAAGVRGTVWNQPQPRPTMDSDSDLDNMFDELNSDMPPSQVDAGFTLRHPACQTDHPRSFLHRRHLQRMIPIPTWTTCSTS